MKGTFVKETNMEEEKWFVIIEMLFLKFYTFCFRFMPLATFTREIGNTTKKRVREQ